MNLPNQRDPFGYPKRRAKGCSPGLLMFVMLGFFAFWMMSKGRNNSQPSLPDGRQESRQVDNGQGVPFPDVLPSGTERDSSAGVFDGTSPAGPRSNRSASPGNANGDWSLDTNVGGGSGAELQLEPAGTSRGGETKRGDWSLDTDVRKD